MNQVKCCTRCGIEKILEQFSKRGGGHHASWCKDCRSEYARKWWRHEHPFQRQRYELPTPEGKKWCAICQQWKDVEEFSKSHSLVKGRSGYCRQCDSDKHLARAFGLTRNQYDTMLESQGGVCACCGSDVASGRGNFHVDHNHQTGQIRGLLCLRCNTAIGQFEDDPQLLRKAMEYLLKGTLCP